VYKHARSKKISETCLAKSVILDIIKSVDGIDNLKSTYSDDVKFMCDIDAVTQSIVPRLKELYQDYKHLFITEDDSLLTFTSIIQKE